MRRLLTAADLRIGERVVDIGCGPGLPTLAAAVPVGESGRALGVDISEELVRVARSRAEQVAIGNVTFEVLDAQTDQFPGAPFDVAMSRNGLMFFDDPPSAFVNIRRQLRTGGRFVFTCFPQEVSGDSSLGVVMQFAGDYEPTDRAEMTRLFGLPWIARSLGDRETTRTLLKNSGFGLVRCRAFSYVFSVSPGKAWSPRLLDPLGLSDARRLEAEFALRAWEEAQTTRGKVRFVGQGLVFSATAW
jgi:ubiquinone/menaquinone biosynthesis C-methylase UbiE